MKKFLFVNCGPLFVALLIYLFYRTEDTIVNKLVLTLVDSKVYFALKTSITNNFPLNNILIYSLPEGLWMFSITYLSLNYYVELCKVRIPLHCIPISYAVLLEFAQLCCLINGTFDWWDILSSGLFWLLAVKGKSQFFIKRNLLEAFDFSSGFCVFNYLIVYLSHVCK
jgi:hypothetical protein